MILMVIYLLYAKITMTKGSKTRWTHVLGDEEISFWERDVKKLRDKRHAKISCKIKIGVQEPVIKDMQRKIIKLTC